MDAQNRTPAQLELKKGLCSVSFFLHPFYHYPPYMDPPTRKSRKLFFDPYRIVDMFDGKKFPPYKYPWGSNGLGPVPKRGGVVTKPESKIWQRVLKLDGGKVQCTKALGNLCQMPHLSMTIGSGPTKGMSPMK